MASVLGQLDDERSADLDDPGLDGEASLGGAGLINTLAKYFRGAAKMHVHTALVGGSIGMSGVGLLAEATADVPPTVSWACVILAAIPLATLVVKVFHAVAMRRIESVERLAMINKGMVPPPYGPAPIAPFPVPVPATVPTPPVPPAASTSAPSTG